MSDHKIYLANGSVHAPKYQYDCTNCKFSWCCGKMCSCVLSRDKLPDPPEERKHEVDQALVKGGYAPQFYGKEAQRR